MNLSSLHRIGFFHLSLDNIRSSEKFLSFYKGIIDAQHCSFYIILTKYVWFILFYQDKDHNVRQIRFHVCIKMRCCKRRVCKRKTLFGQPNIKVQIVFLAFFPEIFICEWKFKYSWPQVRILPTKYHEIRLDIPYILSYYAQSVYFYTFKYPIIA